MGKLPYVLTSMNEQVSLSRANGVTIVKILGRAGVEAASTLHEELLQSSVSEPVVIDWGLAEHVEASVLQVLIAHQNSVQVEGQALSVQVDNPRVREYLNLSGLAMYFPMTGSVSTSGFTGDVHG